MHNYDFDNPNAMDIQEIVDCLDKLAQGQAVDVSVTHTTRGRMGISLTSSPWHRCTPPHHELSLIPLLLFVPVSSYFLIFFLTQLHKISPELDG